MRKISLCTFIIVLTIGLLTLIGWESDSVEARSDDSFARPDALLLTDDFSYTAGSLLTANSWTAHSAAGTFAQTVVSPGLSYPGYLGSDVGNAVSMTTSGEDVHRVFPTQSTGTVYAAAMVRLTNAADDPVGGHFFHLATDPIGVNFRGRVFVKRNASNEVAFGISKLGSVVASDIAYTGFNYALNTTYLVVIKYTIVGGIDNDTVEVFVNPTLGGSEPAPNAIAPDAAATDINPGSIALRQGTATTSPTLAIDGIRIGTSWTDVTTTSGATPTPTVLPTLTPTPTPFASPTPSPIATPLEFPGKLDETFKMPTGFNDAVLTAALQTDGKIVMGGNFTQYNGFARNRVARLNVDGSLDTSFNIGSGTNNTVNVLTVQPDGKILVGGEFVTYDGASSQRLVRLNADGSRDLSFDIGTGLGGAARSIVVQPDGKILVSGSFGEYNGIIARSVVRLNADGTRDFSFSTGSGFAGNYVLIALQPDGKIVCGGDFNGYNGTPLNKMVRLNTNGSRDATFDVGAGPDGGLNDVAIQPDGKVLVTGLFFNFAGVTSNRIARVNTDGSRDTTFNTGTGFEGVDINGVTIEVGIQPDGKIVVSGFFSTFNGVSRNRMARLNTNGSLDATFDIGSGFSSRVFPVVIQTDGKIVTGGDFTFINGVSKQRAARLNPNGSLDSSYIGSGFNSTVNSFTVQPDEKIIAAGSFTSYNGFSFGRIVRLGSDASIDTTFNTGSGFSGDIAVVTLQDDDKALVGGLFTSFNNQTANSLVRLNEDGSRDSSFNIGTGANLSVGAIAVQDDGKVVVGGTFSQFNGVTTGRLIRLNPDGSVDGTFNIGAGFNNTVSAIVIEPDGRIIVAGFFSTLNGNAMPRIVRLLPGGQPDTSFAPGTGPNGGVNSVALQNDSKIMIVGSFTTFNGTSSPGIARLNPNGSRDTGFLIGTGFSAIQLNRVIVQADGKIVVGGGFTSFNGSSANRIAVLNPNGSLDTTFIYGSGFNTSVLGMATQPDGKLLFGGFFSGYNGIAVERAVRLFSLFRANTTIAITADGPDPSPIGALYRVSIAITPSTPGGPAPTGVVLVSDGTNRCRITLPTNFCDLPGTTSGIRSLRATYLGDANYDGSVSDEEVIHSVGFELAIGNVTLNEGNAGTRFAAFDVLISDLPPVGAPAVTIDFATIDGTATVADGDYAAATGQLTFASNSATTLQRVNVTVNGDTKFEPNEAFVVRLSNPVNAVAIEPNGTGTIFNDDTEPAFSVNSISLNEGNSGTTPFTFTFTRSGNATAFSSTLNYTTANASAVAPGDYAAASGSIVFAPNETTKTVVVNVVGDTTEEPNETFSMIIVGVSNGTIGTGTGIGTILNDEGVVSARPEGDVVDGSGGPNGDNLVLSNDVTVIRQMVLGNIPPPSSGPQFQAADTNRTPEFNECGNGRIDAGDVAVIAGYNLGTFPLKPVCGPTAEAVTADLVEVNIEDATFGVGSWSAFRNLFWH